jgi:hypothetical protein
MIRPDPVSMSVEKSASVAVRNSQTNVSLNQNATLRRTGDATYELGGLARPCLRRRGRARTHYRRKDQYA